MEKKAVSGLPRSSDDLFSSTVSSRGFGFFSSALHLSWRLHTEPTEIDRCARAYAHSHRHQQTLADENQK